MPRSIARAQPWVQLSHDLAAISLDSTRFGEEATHKLIEGNEVAEATLDDRKQMLLILGLEAIGLARVEVIERFLGVRAEVKHADALLGPAHAQPHKKLGDTPQPRGVGAPCEH